jgi:hypothetical protein
MEIQVMEKRSTYLSLIALFLFLAILPTSGRAAMQEYGFFRITHNSPVNPADQFTVQVTDEGVAAGRVLFKFLNSGSIDTTTSIRDIYFKDGSLLAMSDLIDIDENSLTWLSWGNNNAAPVDFSRDAVDPPTLPGGAPYGFESPTATFFATDSDNVAPNWQTVNGVGTGESLGIVFDLKPLLDIDDVFSALSLGSRTGGLRIGFKARIDSTNDTDSFVDIAPVPVPAAVLLGLLGLGVAGLRLRRFA